MFAIIRFNRVDKSSQQVHFMYENCIENLEMFCCWFMAFLIALFSLNKYQIKMLEIIIFLQRLILNNIQNWKEDTHFLLSLLAICIIYERQTISFYNLVSKALNESFYIALLRKPYEWTTSSFPQLADTNSFTLLSCLHAEIVIAFWNSLIYKLQHFRVVGSGLQASSWKRGCLEPITVNNKWGKVRGTRRPGEAWNTYTGLLISRGLHADGLIP